MSKRALLLTVITVFLLAVGMVLPVLAAKVASTPISDEGIVPYIIDGYSGPSSQGGNRTCADVGIEFYGDADYYEFSSARYNYPTIPGTIGPFSVQITNGTYVSWQDGFVDAAFIVKGSAAANVYVYDGSLDSDSGLASPPAGSGPAGLSNLTVCWNGEVDFEKLDVSKTVVTTYDREHFWAIDKWVETENGYTEEGEAKIWLFTDSSGDETATWYVDVTYEGYQDYGWNVSGTITIENTGTLDATINSVDDVLAGSPIDVDCSVTFPYVLPVGGKLECTYSEDGYVEGFNEASVTTEVTTYYADPVEIEWGDPANEVNKTVNVKDVSDLFGVKDLGTVTAPNGDKFSYTKDFAYDDYFPACGHFEYDNTATIVETGQTADATLKVNVQCYDCETAWAANGLVPGSIRYTNRGNWATYVDFRAGGTKTVNIYAAQTYYVGTATFTKLNGTASIDIDLDDGVILNWNTSEAVKIQGYNSAPSGNPSPGLFTTYKGGLPVPNVPYFKYYGVHLDLCYPDPDFGPNGTTSLSTMARPVFGKGN
jgi:hypothetical protein